MNPLHHLLTPRELSDLVNQRPRHDTLIGGCSGEETQPDHADGLVTFVDVGLHTPVFAVQLGRLPGMH